MRKQWSALAANNIVRAQHWRHDDGPRPTLCVIHGFMGSSYLLNGLFFSLPWYYRSGYDVLLYTLPFHGRRAEKFSPFSGFGYFASGLSGFAESMAQAVHDFRSVVDYLRHTGVERVALTGISLGGYTSALLATVEDRLEAVIPNCPVVTPAKLFDEWFPANELVRLGLRLTNINRDELERRDGLSLPTELSAGDPQEPPDDHHRPRRSDGSARARRNALGALGSLRAALVPRQPRDARESAGLPAPDDPVPARLHVRLAASVSGARWAPVAGVGQFSRVSRSAGAAVCPSSRCVDNRSNAISAGRWFPRCGVRPASGAAPPGSVSVRKAHAAATV